MKRSAWPWLASLLVLGILLLPLAATLHASLISPDGDFSFSAYRILLSEPHFQEALRRTAALSAGSVAVALLIMTPLGFTVAIYAPKLARPMRALMLAPYAIPGVVTAAALLRVYGENGHAAPWVLCGAYFVWIMPVVYQGVSNALFAIDVQPLAEAAETLGASPAQIFLRVVLPGIMPGVLSAGLLSFAALLSEYALASMLLGSTFDTVQMLLRRLLALDTRLASAMVVAYLSAMTLICLLFLWIMPRARQRKGGPSDG